MIRPVGVSDHKLRLAWRQRGYHDGFAARERSTNVPAKFSSSYAAGYRSGVAARERVAGEAA